MSSSKRMLKTLTYEEKVAVIRELENGLKSKSLIAKEFGIPLNTLSTYLKNKEITLNKLATSSIKAEKRLENWKILTYMSMFTNGLNRHATKKYPLVGC